MFRLRGPPAVRGVNSKGVGQGTRTALNAVALLLNTIDTSKLMDLKVYSHMSHVTVQKILRAGFPSPLNTSGSHCFKSENWPKSRLLLKFITTEKAVIFIIFKLSFI